MTNNDDKLLIGVISDTHGYLRPKAIQVFKDVDLIIHAGDIGDPDVIHHLKSLAPVHMVRGNMDGWAYDLPETEMVKIGTTMLYILHDLNTLDMDPAAAGIRVVISGHTHKPLAEMREGILYLNPGSASRYQSSPTVALLHVNGATLNTEMIEI